MAKLNQTLFLFSKLDLDQVPFHWETVDLCSWMRDYVEKQREHWEQNGLHLTFSTALTAAPIRMDRDQFARVLENLLGNSWKYKTEKAGTLAIALKPQGKTRSGWNWQMTVPAWLRSSWTGSSKVFTGRTGPGAMCPPAAAWDWRWSGKSPPP